MIIYHSMILWIAFWGIFYTFTKQQNINRMRNNSEKRVPMHLALITFGYIIFWAGIRSGVADTATYILGFENYPSNLSAIVSYWSADDKAPGFATFNILFKCLIADDYHVWLMTIALVSGISVMLTLRKHSEGFFYSAFLFVVTLDFFWMFNGMRQFIVAAILFAFSDWIIERKTIPFLLLILVLSTIHYTAIVMLPVYWIVTEKPFGKKILLFIVALLLCVIFIEPFVETLETALSETAYSGATEQFALDDGVNPIRVLVMTVPSFIAFVGRKRLGQTNNKYINLCINMSLVSAGIYFLGMFTSGILVGRLPIYFELYNLVLLPYLLKKCFTRQSSKIMFVLCAVSFLGFYYIQMENSYYISDLTGLIGG